MFHKIVAALISLSLTLPSGAALSSNSHPIYPDSIFSSVTLNLTTPWQRLDRNASPAVHAIRTMAGRVSSTTDYLLGLSLPATIPAPEQKLGFLKKTGRNIVWAWNNISAKGVAFTISCVLGGFTLFLLWKARNPALVIGDFRIPPPIQQQLYKEDVLPTLIKYQITEMRTDVERLRDHGSLSIGPEKFPDLEVPGFGKNLDSVVGIMRELLGIQSTSIHGVMTWSENSLDETRITERRVDLKLWVMQGDTVLNNVVFRDMEVSDVSTLVERISAHTLSTVDPITFALYSLLKTNDDSATEKALLMKTNTREENARQLLLKGYVALIRGKADAAIHDFHESINLRQADEPSNAPAYQGLAQAYQMNNRFAEAEMSYLKALSLDNNSQRAMLGLGKLYVEWSRYKDAEKYLAMAQERDPGSFEVNRAYGMMHTWSGDYTKAVMGWESAYDASGGGDNETRAYLAWALTLSKEFAEAKKHLEAILNEEPKNALAHSVYGIWWQRQNPDINSLGFKTGLAFHRKAIALSPKDPFVAYHLATAFPSSMAHLGIPYLREVLEARPHWAEGIFQYGRAVADTQTPMLWKSATTNIPAPLSQILTEQKTSLLYAAHFLSGMENLQISPSEKGIEDLAKVWDSPNNAPMDVKIVATLAQAEIKLRIKQDPVPHLLAFLHQVDKKNREALYLAIIQSLYVSGNDLHTLKVIQSARIEFPKNLPIQRWDQHMLNVLKGVESRKNSETRTPLHRIHLPLAKWKLADIDRMSLPNVNRVPPPKIIPANRKLAASL